MSDLLHGYLTRRAQRTWPTALVLEDEAGEYRLERAGEPPLRLGQDHGEARQALDALAAALRARQGD